MKQVLAVIILIMLAGCVSAPQTVVIDTLTRNGCAVDKYHQQSTAGVVDITCK